MIEIFWFVRLGEGEVCRNVVWKLQRSTVLCDNACMHWVSDRSPSLHCYIQRRITVISMQSHLSPTYTTPYQQTLPALPGPWSAAEP